MVNKFCNNKWVIYWICKYFLKYLINWIEKVDNFYGVNIVVVILF